MGILCRLLTISIAILSLVPQSLEARTYFHQDQDSSIISNQPAPSPATEPSSSDLSIFNVRSFGAVGDGITDDTKAFMSAWMAACSVEYGVLLVPSDGVFMITYTTFYGPCQPGLVFQVDGVLMPPDGPEEWPKSDSKLKWLVFTNVDGMTMEGEGSIEGNGEKWWNLPCKPHKFANGTTLQTRCDSPVLIIFYQSYNLYVRNLRIENSPQFHVKFDHCEGVYVEGLSITSPASSPNTDGIHIGNSNSVTIYNSIIGTGDDCISIGSGSSAIHIENVTCGPSHGISIGSLGENYSEACVSNITVKNVVIKDSDNGIRIKTWQGGKGSVSGIRFDGVFMDNTKNCIIIDQYYCLTADCANKTSAVHVTDVTYNNIVGTYNATTRPVHLACSDAVPCTDITIADVNLKPHQGEVAQSKAPICWNAYGVLQTGTVPPISCLKDGNPLSLQEKPGFGC